MRFDADTRADMRTLARRSIARTLPTNDDDDEARTHVQRRVRVRARTMHIAGGVSARMHLTVPQCLAVVARSCTVCIFLNDGFLLPYFFCVAATQSNRSVGNDNGGPASPCPSPPAGYLAMPEPMSNG